ncbi:MAG: hypothetical protein FJ405_08705 [Verrucomicrobia bacterium]|nr:hypothetical protein [Verrucomicrobiota bacterium]
MITNSPKSVGTAFTLLAAFAGVGVAEEASQHITTALSSTTISGFVDTSAQWNFGRGSGTVPGIPYLGPAKADGFNLNYVQITLQKPLDANDNWAAGYRVDVGHGPDLAGFGTVGAGATGIKQAYVALRAPVGNGIDFKMGVFDTIIGYETFERVSNPHYSHSYGNGLEPTSHTGLLASYQLTENIGVSVGVANSTAPLINNRLHTAATPPSQHAESYKTYMASLSAKAPDSWGALAGSALYAGVVNGAGNAANSAAQAAQNFYVGATINTPWTGVKFGVAYDYFGKEDTSVERGLGSARGDAISVYTSIKLTEKLTLLARGEHYEQSASGVGPTVNNGGGALPTRVLAGTATLQYDLWANVLSRLEFRWDHDADGGVNGAATNAYGTDGGRKNDFMVAANVIYKF